MPRYQGATTFSCNKTEPSQNMSLKRQNRSGIMENRISCASVYDAVHADYFIDRAAH